MQYRKKVIITGIWLICAIWIHLYSNDSLRVETGYATHFFPPLSRFLRAVFGFLPFSIGDLLYGTAAIFLCIKIFVFCRFIFTPERSKNYRSAIRKSFISVVQVCSIIYISFNLLWGINYNRVGISGQLGLTVEKYSLSELKIINAVLAEKLNASKQILLKNKTDYPERATMFLKTTEAYRHIAEKYPFLDYKFTSIKPSIWSAIGNYTGFVGYYNPFTGEAQVNTAVPAFTQPFTACHEMAHQLGYAKEMEANFVGYLAASSSKDTIFQYSVYADVFTYANRSLYYADSTAALQYRKILLPEVIADFKARKKFNAEHTSFAEPIFRALYGTFLKTNQQPMGILSYDEVTGFIIAYYKKFGMI